MAFKKGNIAWNRGKHIWTGGGGKKGKHYSPSTEFKKGHHAWHRGKKTGLVPKSAFKRGFDPWNKGKKLPDYSGENANNWQGGKSFELYGLEFNDDLKEVIRNRDRRKCQMCKKIELENKELLIVHHRDYNKQNNDPKI